MVRKYFCLSSLALPIAKCVQSTKKHSCTVKSLSCALIKLATFNINRECRFRPLIKVSCSHKLDPFGLVKVQFLGLFETNIAVSSGLVRSRLSSGLDKS